MAKIDSVSKMLEFIQTQHSNPFHKHLRYWFRGQSDATWVLSPGVYRQGFKVSSEDERLKKEQHIYQDFSVNSASVIEKDRTPADLYFLQQHYGLPTRLLDWTTNPLTALFFAVEDEGNQALPVCVFFLDAYKFDKQNYPKGYEGIATSNQGIFTEQLKVITQWKKPSDMAPTVFPLRPNFFDIRIAQQYGCFTFHGRQKEKIDKTDNPTLVKLDIEPNDKSKILEELLTLKIDEFHVYHDLSGLAKSILRNYK